MRFELTVALKYLIPKWRQLSVSIISLLSVLVISLVVWLVILFLSVTEGIEKKWIGELIALNAPVRMTPTEAYYRSYYYKIDSVSLDSNYTSKTLGEKLSASKSDPYDPRVDMELSYDFPPPDRYEDGRVKDLVKEAFDAVNSLPYAGVRAREYEVTFGNLRLQLIREGSGSHETEQTFLTQVSYIASHDGDNRRINQMVLPPTSEDYNNLLNGLVQTYDISEGDAEEEGLFFQQQPEGENLKEAFRIFFSQIQLKELVTGGEGFLLPPNLFPPQGKLKGLGIIRHGEIKKIIIPQDLQHLSQLEEKLMLLGHRITDVDLVFEEKQLHLNSIDSFSFVENVPIILDEKIPFEAVLLPHSLDNADTLNSLQFSIKGTIQHIPISGEAFYHNLAISKAEPVECETNPYWVYKKSALGCHLPTTTSQMTTPSKNLGEGLLIAKHFKNNGVRLGDRGYISYYTLAGSSMQEQRIPVFVAGFYDPGMMPIGNKLIFVDPDVTARLRGNTSIADPLLGNGVNIWLDRLEDTAQFKEELINSLNVRGLGKYWTVQSYHDYEFTRPILEQLQSDKNLFTLIAVIILIVACSNIISMLILLVNEKKREIGILQSMGASPKSIAIIFGLCGFVTGLVSCIIGVTAAIWTLNNLQSLIDLLSFFQGREAFQAAFYGSTLPNDLSFNALIFVLISTLFISLLAGVIPAVKASKIRPSEILRSE